MYRKDLRKAGRRTNEHIRITAVEMVRKQDIRPTVVTKLLKLSDKIIYLWLRVFDQEGLRGLREKKAPGRQSFLDDKQKKQVRRWIIGKSPTQWGLDFGLWTRQIVAELILREFNISLSLASVSNLLCELEITPQRPLYRAKERNETAISNWLKNILPQIIKRAKKKGATLLFLDEAGVRSDNHGGRTWGRKGKTPIVKVVGRKQSINAISAVGPRGEFWWDTYKGRFNSDVMIEMLKKLMRNRKKPVILVLDNYSVHTSKKVTNYILSLKGRLTLEFLPSYAPECNPDELVWRQTKSHELTRHPLKQDECLELRVRTILGSIAEKPKLVRSFFKDLKKISGININ